MMEGLLAWIPEIDSSRPRLRRDCLTVRDPRVSLVTRKTGQVSLTQLNPMDTIRLAIASMGCSLSPSATMTSRCDTQFTHASFTLCPFSSTIHRELVDRGRAMTCFCGIITSENATRKEKMERTEKKTILSIGGFVLTWRFSVCRAPCPYLYPREFTYFFLVMNVVVFL